LKAPFLFPPCWERERERQREREREGNGECSGSCNITTKNEEWQQVYMKGMRPVGLPAGSDSDRSKAQKE